MQIPPLRIADKRLADYGSLRWLLIVLRAVPLVLALLADLTIRTCLCPLIPFWHVKRYIGSAVNLVCMRVVLLCLGFLRFECDSFKFFSSTSPKLTLRSGYIAVGSHHSIVDYLYYSYLVNPVFVRLIIYCKEGKEEIYYAPLGFLEGFRSALQYRGFDPIVVHNEREFRAVRYRKMAMKTLISECFEGLCGGIFIMLPGLNPSEHICLNRQVSYDIFQNELQFERSLVGFFVKMDPYLQQTTYRNQLFLLIDLLSFFSINHLSISAVEFRKFKNRYDRTTYSAFVDKYYSDHEMNLREINYETYLRELDALEGQLERERVEKKGVEKEGVGKKE